MKAQQWKARDGLRLDWTEGQVRFWRGMFGGSYFSTGFLNLIPSMFCGYFVVVVVGVVL